MFVPRSLSSSNPLHKTFPLHIPTHIPFSSSLPLGRKTLILHGSGRVGIGSGRRRLEGVRSQNGGEALSSVDEEWIKKLPDKKKPLYAHSLPCIEAWLRQLGFFQNGDDDRALWIAEKHDWHARLSLDITDLHIRYLKSGPGNLVKDVERRFSYALSREDIENAILGGP